MRSTAPLPARPPIRTEPTLVSALFGNRRARPAVVRLDAAPAPVVDALTGSTQADVERYFERAAPLMLPHLRNRPLAVVSAPAGVDGALFFKRHAVVDEFPGLRLFDRSLYRGHPPLLGVAAQRGVVSAARRHILEFHTWNASTRALGRPDRIVFDIGAGPGRPWADTSDAALALQQQLLDVGLVPFVKTSGGRGLHVVVPLMPKHDAATVCTVAESVVKRLETTIPQRFVAQDLAENPDGHPFIDVRCNGKAATTVAAWSPRARPGLGISVPIEWHELKQLTGGAHWTMTNIAPRLERGNQPWKDYASSRQGLGRALRALDLQPGEQNA